MDTTYRERLWVPWTWWLVVAFMTVSVWWVFVLVAPTWVALGAAALAGVVMSVACLRWSLVAIDVRDGELRAGRAHIGLSWCGAATALNAKQARDLAGPRCDARAFLMLRPYVGTAVRVIITDPDDPAPYWLVCSRDAERLAAVLSSRTDKPK